MRHSMGARTACLALGFGLSLAAAPQAAAQSSFDGRWSVVIRTIQDGGGLCDQGYRYALNIRNGVLSYDSSGGGLSFNVDGRVNRRGAVTVSISRGSDRVDANGRLERNNGSGVWRASRGCSGRWRAERRG